MKTALALAACLACATPAHAESDALDADEIIEACWETVQPDLDSGVTARKQQGIAAASQCLRTRIMENAAPLFAGTGYTPKQQLADIDRYTQGAGAFYWKLYNENRACAPACGTLARVQAGAEIPDLLERLLRDVVETRNASRM